MSQEAVCEIRGNVIMASDAKSAVGTLFTGWRLSRD